MAELAVKNLKKSFGEHEVLKGVDFTVKTGDFLSLLGPSGCGKSTILRCICGLESPDEGSILVDGKDVTRVRPEKRNIGMVFQNYALFPSMNVAKNVGYGLKMQKVPQGEIEERVSEALKLVKLENYDSRRVTHLSGGEQQRVALARALVTKPDILLLDEPLSALDRKIRGEMQYEIRNIQQKVGISTIFVTHDQEEALTMSDRVILIHEGRIEQEGSPWEIYARPVSVFASDFMGKANLLGGRLEQKGDEWFIAGGGMRLPIVRRGGEAGDLVRAAARGEYFRICGAEEPGANLFRLERKVFTGLSWRLIGKLGEQPLDIMALGSRAEHMEEGECFNVKIDPENIVYYLDSGGKEGSL